MTLLCEIYRSPRKQETYLYVDRTRGLEDVPADLLHQFGEPETIMVIALTPQRQLARANTAEVLAAIETQGYYLQMPPTAAQLLSRDNGRE